MKASSACRRRSPARAPRSPAEAGSTGPGIRPSAERVSSHDPAGQSAATMATWYVDNIEHIVAQLTAAGVEFARYDELEHDAIVSPPQPAVATSRGSRTPMANTFAIVS